MNMISEHNSREEMAAKTTEGQVDLFSVLGILFRRKLLVSIICGVFVFCGGYYAYRIAIPYYTASVTIVQDTQMTAFTDLDSVVGNLSGDSQQVNTQVQILKSRRLLGKVVDALNLGDDPEFNTRLRPPTFQARMKTKIMETLGMEASVPVVDLSTLSENERQMRERIARDRYITALSRTITIRNLPKSLVYEISVETTERRKSAFIAETISQTYIDDQLEVKFEETEKVIAWLTERVSEFQQDLEKSQSIVASFSASIDLLSEDALQSREIQLKELRERIAETNTKLLADADLLSKIMTTNDPQIIQDFTSDIELAGYLQNLTADYGQIAAVQQRVAELRSQISEDIGLRERQLAALTSSEVQLKDTVRSQSEDLIELQQLQREAEAERLLYEYFLGRLKETRAQQGIQRADSRVLSPPVIPGSASQPNKKFILAVSGILGFIVASALALILETRQSGFMSARELEKRFGFPVMGQIPLAPVRARTKLMKQMIDESQSVFAEAFRRLRTSITKSNVETPPQVIISTSCVPGEGKTTNSVGIASMLASMNKKVLLLEGDLRRRTLNINFPGLQKKKGIISALLEDAPMEDLLFQPADANFFIIGCEKHKVNAADIISSSKVRPFIEKLRQEFEFIVIDCPPVLAVPDAIIMAELADMTLFNVKWQATSEFQIEEALRMYSARGSRSFGFILSQININKLKKYSSDGQYGMYKNYGESYGER